MALVFGCPLLSLFVVFMCGLVCASHSSILQALLLLIIWMLGWGGWSIGWEWRSLDNLGVGTISMHGLVRLHIVHLYPPL